jgi:hypothetical protein
MDMDIEMDVASCTDVTQYEYMHKPNDYKNHTIYHVKLEALDSACFSLHMNKEKFMLDNIIVCYLKLQGSLQIDNRTENTMYMILTSPPDELSSRCKIYFRFDIGYEISLESFSPKPDILYELIVKPDPRSTIFGDAKRSVENILYAFSIREVKSRAERDFFLERCDLEEKYYREKSIENKNRLALPYIKPATIEETNARLESTTSDHLLAVTSNGKSKYRPPSGGDSGGRR